MRYIDIFISFAFFLLICPPSCFGSEDFDPWDFDKGVPATRGTIKITTDEQKGRAVPASLLVAAAKFFRDHISPVDGDRCPMYPTCAAYSIQAIEKHGFIAGYLMTVDRLIHENNEMDYVPIVAVGSGYRYWDPVEANDFWWSENHFP
jgi:putative component of membrane protein insertase Oxa1/YidC/SpoIIIJ protein YidD